MKNTLRPALVIIAIILGVVIYKHFDFRTATFKDPWLDGIYIITFAAVIFALARSKKQSSGHVEK
ncbi:hypothetical protein [Chryseobacterium salviniae]|uniref:Uncharacterized protein n=1 Tax=Chryseobacterium salviniae TaxID=3101750 RepID=A0ABU6HUT4_9FLAO|nr:hypothetical protein [Chryseobacterium sp. T9W2-O]MEC3875860.1 hypothetical protein [Chryseobacterium sp. T9W2-O]